VSRLSAARRRLGAIVGAACALALVPTGAPASAPPAPEQLTLRLADLEPGYELTDDYALSAPHDCYPMELSGGVTPSELEDVGRHPHPGCRISFQRAWPAAAPLYVSSVAFVPDDATRPQQALASPRSLAARVFDVARETYEVTEPAPAIGDEAVLLRTDPVSALRGTLTSAIVLWRSGAVLGLLQTYGSGGIDSTVQATTRLASVQQGRILAPTPVGPLDNDDLEVPLDDPRLDVAVQWLGRDLIARGRLPQLKLLDVVPADRSETREGLRGSLVYGRSTDYETVTVGLMHPSTLRRPSNRRELRAITRHRCTGSQRVALAAGHAMLYWPIGRCGQGFAFSRFALAALPGVRVVIFPSSSDSCSHCSGPINRYATRAGMRRLVRALRPRSQTS
jgi:hypothetical protein